MSLIMFESFSESKKHGNNGNTFVYRIAPSEDRGDIKKSNMQISRKIKRDVFCSVLLAAAAEGLRTRCLLPCQGEKVYFREVLIISDGLGIYRHKEPKMIVGSNARSSTAKRPSAGFFSYLNTGIFWQVQGCCNVVCEWISIYLLFRTGSCKPEVCKMLRVWHIHYFSRQGDKKHRSFTTTINVG